VRACLGVQVCIDVVWQTGLFAEKLPDNAFFSASAVVLHACGMVVGNRRSPPIEQLFASQTMAF
jgi:hypothetical protein